jgi:hypothetical protein
MPVNVSNSPMRAMGIGTSPASQRQNVVLLTPNALAASSSDFSLSWRYFAKRVAGGLRVFMPHVLAHSATYVKSRRLHFLPMTNFLWSGRIASMSSVAEIHQGKEPIRRHYIKEWAELRGMKPVDLATELGVEISQATRWFDGQMPRKDTQLRLAQLFGGEDANPNIILRHPDDDWLAKFFADRTEAERARIREAMELLFPRQNNNRGQ